MAVAHALIPVNYTKAGPYEVDLALGNPVLPGLAPVADLAAMDPTSDDAGFLRTRLVRERNRVWHAFATARRDDRAGRVAAPAIANAAGVCRPWEKRSAPSHIGMGRGTIAAR